MERFFKTLFGTLAAIGCGIAISWGGARAWYFLAPKIAAMQVPSVSAVTAAITAAPTDGSTIAGMSRVVRYTANEEEDIVDETTRTLPAGADTRITASSYLVEDLTTGKAAVQHDDSRLLPIASLTKLVTAVVARKLIPVATEIAITPAIMSTFGNTADFRAGETFTAADLLYPLLMVSSNDAAEAYAQTYGRARFIKAMNDFTQSIGAYNTIFADPSGLSPENESSADDLAKIVQWIRVNDPAILTVTQLKNMSLRGHTWTNPAHFLSWSYYVGGKNGYTDEAGLTSVSLFTLGPKKDVYIIVLLGSRDRDTDIIKLLAKVR